MKQQSASIVVTLKDDQSLSIDIDYLPEGSDPNNMAWRLVKSIEQILNEINQLNFNSHGYVTFYVAFFFSPPTT